MRITQVNIRLVRQKSLVGYADLVFDNMYKVCDIGIHQQVEGEENYRLTFPEKKLSNGRSIVRHHPLNKYATTKIVDAISQEMDRLTKEIGE